MMDTIVGRIIFSLFVVSGILLVPACGKKERHVSQEDAKKYELEVQYYNSCIAQMKDAVGPNNTATDWAKVMEKCETQAYLRARQQ